MVYFLQVSIELHYLNVDMTDNEVKMTACSGCVNFVTSGYSCSHFVVDFYLGLAV